MTLYERHREAFDEIAQTWPLVAEMAKRFKEFRHMNDAIGLQKGAENWVKRKGQVGGSAYGSVRNWLAANPTPVNHAAVAPKPAASGVMLLIVCPDGVAPKIERIAAMMGCEVTDI